jgi:hypothetical protein
MRTYDDTWLSHLCQNDSGGNTNTGCGSRDENSLRIHIEMLM